jgi:S1-C subfamily serine protease
LPYEFEPGDPPRVILSGVTPASPAEQAGLRAGDQLLSFQGETIRDEARFRLALLAASGQTEFLVKRPGSEQPLLVKITPLGEPIRVGISWRSDDAEPGTVLVTQVVFGSAAHAAGLEVGERIYGLGDRGFATAEEFSTLLGTLPGPLDVLVERDGKLRTVQLDVLDPPPPAAE